MPTQELYRAVEATWVSSPWLIALVRRLEEAEARSRSSASYHSVLEPVQRTDGTSRVLTAARARELGEPGIRAGGSEVAEPSHSTGLFGLPPPSLPQSPLRPDDSQPVPVGFFAVPPQGFLAVQQSGVQQASQGFPAVQQSGVQQASQGFPAVQQPGSSKRRRDFLQFSSQGPASVTGISCSSVRGPAIATGISGSSVRGPASATGISGSSVRGPASATGIACDSVGVQQVCHGSQADLYQGVSPFSPSVGYPHGNQCINQRFPFVQSGMSGFSRAQGGDDSVHSFQQELLAFTEDPQQGFRGFQGPSDAAMANVGSFPTQGTIRPKGPPALEAPQGSIRPKGPPVFEVPQGSIRPKGPRVFEVPQQSIRIKGPTVFAAISGSPGLSALRSYNSEHPRQGDCLGDKDSWIAQGYKGTMPISPVQHSVDLLDLDPVPVIAPQGRHSDPKGSVGMSLKLPTLHLLLWCRRPSLLHHVPLKTSQQRVRV